jgi:methylenetetrahydrofolate dehydrogenase (NADP+)/methenyltetrahydrofolate cyclohydrolase
MAKRLGGGPLREALLAQVPAAVVGLAVLPRLAVVLVGNDPASALYVRHKMMAAEKAGLAAQKHRLKEADGEAALHGLLDSLAADKAVTGVLLQLPLPAGWSVEAALARIPVAKDCDGLAPETIKRRLAGDQDVTQPATPLGVMRLLGHIGQPVAGVAVAVIGQGRVAGKPMAEMLQAAGAKVTVIDRGTPAPAGLVRQAEVVISAAGHPGLVTAEWVKPGAVVVDIGLTRVEGKILGDVAPEVAKVARWLTPVPGGVGPLTIASLLTNVVDGARRVNGVEAWAWTIPPV